MTNAVIFGRFQPFHNSHYKILETALNTCDKVYIGIGSANVSGTLKNPMSVFERKAYIKDYITHNIQKPELLDRIGFIFIDDYLHDSTFLREINRVMKERNISHFFGHKKSDGSSYWVDDLYKTYENLPIFVDVETHDDISSTKIRQMILEGRDVGNYDWTDYREYARKIKEYNDKFVHPYCNVSTHLAVDCLIHNKATKKILLIKRNKGFGSGKYAMIGGFVEPHEDCYDAMKRELFEETGIEYDKLKQTNYIVNKVIDTPTRSDRGRIVTKIYKIEINNETNHYINPIIDNFIPNDEVSELAWIDEELFNSIIKYNLFEDHSLIVNSVVGF